jgi:acetyl-CoA carboxylase carboxyl transferase subunit beta
VKETIGKELPDGFQRAEFVLEHGFLDAIIVRRELKEKLSFALRMLHSHE